MNYRSRIAVSLFAVGLVVTASSCGSNSEGGEQLRPLNEAEASRLAQVGFANLQAGGATFEANSAFLGQPTTSITLIGEVDWVRHVGRAVVRGDGMETGLTEIYWDEQTVYERRPSMDVMIQSIGGPTEGWIARPADPANRQLDRLIAVVAALAVERPENALLIQQAEGSSFIRTDELRGDAVEVLRYGDRSLFWLKVSDGALLRFEGNSSTGMAPAVVDIIQSRSLIFAMPPVQVVVPIEAVAEFYAQMVEN